MFRSSPIDAESLFPPNSSEFQPRRSKVQTSRSQFINSVQSNYLVFYREKVAYTHGSLPLELKIVRKKKRKERKGWLDQFSTGEQSMGRREGELSKGLGYRTIIIPATFNFRGNAREYKRANTRVVRARLYRARVYINTARHHIRTTCIRVRNTFDTSRER